MLPASTPALTLSTLHDASVLLTRCRSLREVLNIMESILAGITGSDEFDIVWADRPSRSLRAPDHTSPAPTEEQRAQLADGVPVVCPTACYIPLLAYGTLRGWFVLGGRPAFDQALTIWAAHCAAVLVAMIPSEKGTPPIQPSLVPTSARGNDIQTTFSMTDVADQIVQAIQGITGSPRILLGLVNAEQRAVRAISVFGLPAPSRRRRGPEIDFDDWLKMVKRSIPLGTMTFHVGRHPLLPSFTSAVVVQIPGLREVPEGVIVIEMGEHSLPLNQNLVGNIELMATQAGSTLSSTRLYAEQQQTVDRLTALNALSLAMSTSRMSVDDMLNMALAGAVGTTGGEGGGAVVIWEGRPVQHFDSPQGTHISATWIERWRDTDNDYVECSGAMLPPEALANDIQYVLIAPLRGTNLSLGALWIEYSQPSIDQAEREMIVLYAKMAGSMLENMYLDELVVNTRDRLASILRSAHEGMVLIDEHGRVGVANRAFGELIGVDETTWEGRHMDEFCGDHELLGMSRPVRIEICDQVRDVLQGRQENASGEVALDTRVLTWQVLPVSGLISERNAALLVIHDVTAERRMESLRQDLSNMIVHDLRAPLTNIMVSVDLLLKQNATTMGESQRRILQIASTSCQQMLDLVNALLDIRRLQQQTIELHRQPVQLIDLAENVRERLEQIGQDQRIQIDAAFDALPAVLADPDMIRRVVQTLVDNALKFSHPRTAVVIAGRVADASSLPPRHASGQWVVVSVQDRGIGIPEQYHSIIFELFTQAPGGYGNGTGVGLAFCKLAVEAHGGMIWVESVPDQGTTFFFALPIAER